MSIEQDKEDLLDALYLQKELEPSRRPALVTAHMQHLPEWDRERLTDAAQALETAGDILNVGGPVGWVDLSSKAVKRAKHRAMPSQPINLHIGKNYNSPIQQISAGAHGVQNTSYQINRNDLQQIIDTYHKHVDELGLDAAARRRADAQVATIEAQLQDDPDDTIVKAAGRSLKTIVEGAIGGAMGNAVSNPGVWQLLLQMFG